MKTKKIGIGYENYKEFVDENLYYVDKTLIIRDLLEKGGKVNLFTRPRRFGKTLALSTVRTFFEAEYDRDGNPIEKQHYFEGKKIMDAGEDVLSKMGKYPVIKLSLKSAKQPNFQTAFLKLREEILWEYSRHAYLAHSDKLDENSRKRFDSFYFDDVDWTASGIPFSDREGRKAALSQEVGRYATSLKTLSECLQQYHGQNVILLLDEYDVPLENAFFSGFYPEMVGFIRSLFESALKTNDTLEFAMVTGCLRISRESIFTGLNHLNICSIRTDSFDEYFGFTQEETEGMLNHYGLSSKVEEVRKWYDGYFFGQAEVYNPWSVCKYVYDHRSNPGRLPEPYWANTSSNQIIKDFVFQADEDQKQTLARLIDGGTIERPVHEDMTYDEIDKSEDNLWNFLYFTGYMKKVSERANDNDILVTMCIPNIEVRTIYKNHIVNWFNQTVRDTFDKKPLYEAIRTQDADGIARIVTGLLKQMISTFDGSESFYHGFFLALVHGMPDYAPRSNREAGNGRPDIILYPETPEDPAYIFELKARKKFNEMKGGVEEALTQISEQNYAEGVLEDGYAGSVAFGLKKKKKSCIARLFEKSDI